MFTRFNSPSKILSIINLFSCVYQSAGAEDTVCMLPVLDEITGPDTASTQMSVK
jgi:hypothetical protein